jgi:hypothetical protein
MHRLVPIIIVLSGVAGLIFVLLGIFDIWLLISQSVLLGELGMQSAMDQSFLITSGGATGSLILGVAQLILVYWAITNLRKANHGSR